MAVNEVMAALSDETRRQILEILRKGKTNTGDLATMIGMIPISSGVGNTNLGRIFKNPANCHKTRRLLKPANPINCFEYLLQETS